MAEETDPRLLMSKEEADADFRREKIQAREEKRREGERKTTQGIKIRRLKKRISRFRRIEGELRKLVSVKIKARGTLTLRKPPRMFNEPNVLEEKDVGLFKKSKNINMGFLRRNGGI